MGGGGGSPPQPKTFTPPPLDNSPATNPIPNYFQGGGPRPVSPYAMMANMPQGQPVSPFAGLANTPGRAPLDTQQVNPQLTHEQILHLLHMMGRR